MLCIHCWRFPHSVHSLRSGHGVMIQKVSSNPSPCHLVPSGGRHVLGVLLLLLGLQVMRQMVCERVMALLRVRMVAGRRRRQRNVVMWHAEEDVRRRSTRREELWRVRHSILPSTLHLTFPLPTTRLHSRFVQPMLTQEHNLSCYFTPCTTAPPHGNPQSILLAH
jgi:hypothetical protein